MHRLQQFSADSGTREELLQFIHDFIDEEALKRIYSDKIEDIYSVADARKLIDKAFDHLSTIYGPKQSTPSQANEAR